MEVQPVQQPDEIARMGEATISERSERVLHFEFADLDNRQELGKRIRLRSTVVLAPERKEILLYGDNSTYAWFDTGHRNRKHYRDVAAYIREKQVLTLLGFAIKNASSSPAEEVHVVLSINVEEGLILRDAQDVPETPSTMFVPKIRGALVEREPTVHVERFGKTYEIKAEVAPRSRSIVSCGDHVQSDIAQR